MYNLLPCLILLPFLGGLLCLLFNHIHLKFLKLISLLTHLLLFSLIIFLWSKYNIKFLESSQKKWLLEYFYCWIPKFNINLHLALDGLSLIMVSLTSLLGIVSVICSLKEKIRYPGFFHFSMLLLVSSTMGIFLSFNMLLFFLFWEITSISMYLLVLIWGKQDTKNYNIKVSNIFMIYSQISGLMMLAVIVILSFINYISNGYWTFEYEIFLNLSKPHNLKYILMFVFFISFAIKVPILPFHNWLPKLQSYTPTFGSLDILGILIKTSVYGILRFVLPFFHQESYKFSYLIIFFSMLSIFYGAFLSCTQNNIKKFISYSSISHMGFIIVSIYSYNHIVQCGAIIYMIAYSLSSTGIILICRNFYKILNTMSINNMKGVLYSIRFIPEQFLFFILSMSGLPGTLNFVGEITILFNIFNTNLSITILLILSLLITLLYSLLIIKSLYFGDNRYFTKLYNINLIDRFLLILLSCTLIILGIFPQYLVNAILSSNF